MPRPQRAAPAATAGMAPWIRNAVMLVTLTGWAVVIVAYIAQGELPDAPLLGVPGAVYFALSPTLMRRPGSAASQAAAKPDEGAA